MRLDFLKNISNSQFTLPLVSIVGLLLWLVLPTAHVGMFDLQEHGLWTLLPSAITQGTAGKLLGLVLAALSIYLIAELTNTFVLLRISSRMLSSSMAVLLSSTLCLHNFQPGMAITVMIVLSYFALFYTYQLSNPVATFLAFMFLSMASLLFPKLLLFVPVYWICLVYLRSFSARAFMASLFGTIVPYWFFLCISLCIEEEPTIFLTTCEKLIEFRLPDYTVLATTDYMIFAFVLIYFLAGIINFVTHSFLDKTRTRIIYATVIFHGIFTLAFIVLQPQYFHTLLPLFMIDSSLVGGHFIALTYNRISHIYSLVMFVLLIALLIAQLIFIGE